MKKSVEVLEDEIKGLEVKIKELVKHEHELEEHEQQLDLIIKHTGVGIWDWCMQTGDTSCNERWANIIGYTLDELAPVNIKTWLKHTHPDDLPESWRLLQEHKAGKTDYYIFESRMKHKNGSWVWVHDSGQITERNSDGAPTRMVGTRLDISQQKEAQSLLCKVNRELEALVRIDALSQIPNRRSLDERLAHELAVSKRNGKPLSVLMVDIDNFKAFNDTYGHEQGDRAIQKIAKRLNESLPRRTDFVARYGGEEFTVLLPATSVRHIDVICQRILSNIANLCITHKHSTFDNTLTVSIGASSTEADAEHVLSHADEALYQAKSNGRNRYETYQPEDELYM